MKKSIIALAVVASMAAQADETTLWGSLRLAYTYDDNGNASSTSDVGDYGSRFGIKGSDDLGNGLSAFYYFEQRMGDSENAKYAYAGLTGGFGTISVGDQLLPRDNISGNSDPTNNTEALGSYRFAMTSTDAGLAYITPDMSGFKFYAAVAADADDATNNHIDAYDLLAEYDANGIYAALGYQSTNVNGGDESANWGLGLGYENDMFNVGLLVEYADVDNQEANPLFARLGGTYNVTPSDSIYGSVAMYDSDVDGADEIWGASVGYQHNFSKRTRVWAEYGYTGETSDNADDDTNVFGLGLRTDF